MPLSTSRGKRLPLVIYIQNTHPAALPPLERSARIFCDSGWRVRFLGVQGFGDASQLAFSDPCASDVRLLPAVAPGPVQKLHYLCFVIWVLGQCLLRRPSLLYASDPASCPAAALVVGLLRVPLVYHEHDSPDASGPGLTTKLLGMARRRTVRHARVCVLPNEARAAAFRTGLEVDPSAVVSVLNCPSRGEFVGDHSSVTGDDDLLIVHFHGSIVPDRLPETVIDALALCNGRVRLRIVGYETVCSVGYVESLCHRAARSGVAQCVSHEGVLPRSEMLSRARASHVGLSLMPLSPADGNQATMAGASNKPFEYLSAGLALLVSDLPDWRAMFVEPGYACPCNPEDPASIAAALEWFRSHPAERRRMGAAGKSRLRSEWNYEKQFAPVLQRLTAPLV